MTVGERIKQRRIELGMSQSDLAIKMGYKNKSAICRVEKDYEQNLTLDRVELFAKSLNCTPAYLMGWDNNTDNRMDYIIELPKDMELLIETYQHSDATTQDIIKKILGLL